MSIKLRSSQCIKSGTIIHNFHDDSADSSQIIIIVIIEQLKQKTKKIILTFSYIPTQYKIMENTQIRDCVWCKKISKNINI